MPSALRCRTLPRAAGCTSPCTCCTPHAICDPLLHSHRALCVCRRAHPSRRFRDAHLTHLTRRSPPWLFPGASTTPQTVAGPLNRSVWQAEEAVANLPVRLAVRMHCAHQACAQHDGAGVRVLRRHSTEGTIRYSRGTLGVCRYRGDTHTGQHAARNALPPSAERAFPPAGSSVCARNDPMYDCSGSSCS